MTLTYIPQVDPEAANILADEAARQRSVINLIASENYASVAVNEAQGSIMTNKYAEGYPGRRYYGGCQHYDEMEQLAIDRAKALFGAEHANVQPHCGSAANMGVYFAVLQPGDTIMSMELSHGGHLSHGSPVSFSGKLYNIVPYRVNDKTHMLEHDDLMKVAKKNKPKLIMCGASAYPRTIDFKMFREVADAVGAYLVADIAHIAGLVASREHPNPVPHCHFVTTTTHKTLRGPRGGLILCTEELAKPLDRAVFPGMQGGPLMHAIAAKAVCFHLCLQQEFKDYNHQIVVNAKRLAQVLMEHGFTLITGGTDNHLMLVDLNAQDITGKDCEKLLQEGNIILNRSTIPNETRSPIVTSGVRIGTPPVTTRGMKEPEMALIADLIAEALIEKKPIGDVKKKVVELCERFPVFAGDVGGEQE